MNKNISPIAASVMTFNGLAMIEAALERDLRVAVFKEENDASTPDTGPFRIKVMPYPLTENSNVITASGATLAEAMGDLGTATLEILDGIVPDHKAVTDLEAPEEKPIVVSETPMYKAIARCLGITLPERNSAQEREDAIGKAIETPEGKRAIVDQIQQALFTTLKPRLGDGSGSN
jgi:hypothetical protein